MNIETIPTADLTPTATTETPKTPTELQNAELASRLRGLAALVESCDRAVSLRLGGKLDWSDSAAFQSPTLPFRPFFNRLTVSVTTQTLKRVQKAEGPEAEQLRAMLKAVIAQHGGRV